MFRLFTVPCVLAALVGCGGGDDGNNNGAADNDRQRMFVTSTSYDGDLGGLAGADATCTSVANNAGISGDYQAILSSSTEDANARILIGGEVYMAGAGGEVVVATSSNNFWNATLLNPINIDENGDTLPLMGEPWTGSNPGGGNSGIALTCQDWTDNGAVLGSTGDTSTTNSAVWINANGFVCNSVRQLYCIEDFTP